MEAKMTKLKIKYAYSKDYKTVPVSGAIATITPQGLIQCEIFTEKPDILNDFTLEVDESGKANEKPQEVRTIVRELHVSMIITPNIARSIGELLINKIDELDQLIEKKIGE